MSSGSKPWRQGSNACGVSADASPRTPKSRMYGRSGQTAGTSPSTAAVSVTSSRSAPPNSSSRISYCSNDRFAGDPSLSCPASSRSSTSIKSGAPSRRAQQRYMDERSTDMDRGMNSARNNPFYALVFHRRKQQQQQQQRADEPIRTLESTCAHFAGSSSSKADASSDDDDRRLYAREKTKEGISDGLDLSSSERHRDVVTPQLVVHASLPTVVPSLTGGDPSDPAPSCEEECVLYSTSRRSSVSESVARFNAAVAGHDRGGRSVMDGEVDKELISIINPETHEPHLGKQARGAACVTSSAPRPRSADSQMGVSHVVRPSSASGSSPRLSDEARPESARMRRVSPSLSSGVDEWGPRAPSALCVSSTSSLGGIRASGFGAQNVHEWPRMTPIEGELTDRVLRTPPYASTASRELVSVSPTTSNSSCGVLSSSSRPMSVATPARSSPCLSVSTNTTVLDQTGGANSSSPHPRGLSARQTPLSSISSTPVGQSADRGGRGLYSVCRSEESSASPWRGTRGGEDWVKEECSPLPVAPREEKTASALSLTSVPSVPPLPLSVVTFAPPYDPDFVSVEGRSVTSSTPPRSVRKWSVPPVPVMRRPPVAPKNHRSVSRALQKHRINPSARRLLAEYVGRTQQASRMTKAWIDDAQEGLPPGSWRPHRYHDRGWATKKRAASGAGISEEPTADDDLWMTLNSSAMDSFLISHGADGDEKFVFLNGESSHGSRSPSQGCSPRSARREKSERRTDGRSPPWRRGDGTISAVEVRSVHTRRLASVSRRTSRQRRGSSTEGTPEHQLLDEWNMAERFAALDRARAENSEVLEETAAARRARRRNRRTSMDLSSTAEDWETLILEEHDELNPSRLLAPDLQSERPVTHPCSSPTRRTSQPTQRMDEITDEHHLSLEVEQPCEAFSALQMGGVGLEERVTDFVSMASADNSAGDALTSPVSMDGADDFTSHGETLPCYSPPTSMPNNDITPPIADFAIPADESPTCVTPINHLSAFTSPQPSARSTGDQLTTPSRSPRLRLSRTPRGTYQPNGLGRSYHVIVHTHEPRQRSQPATESGEVGEACDPPHRVMPSLRGWLERHDEARSDYGRNAASSLSPGSHLTTWRSSGADSSATPPRRGNRRRLVTVSDGKVLKLCMEGSNESSRQRVENSLSPSISEYMPSGRGSRPSPGPMTALLDKSSSSLLGTATGGSSGRHGSQPGTPPPPPARTYTSTTSDVTFVHSQTAPAVQSTETPERLAAASTLHNPLSLLLRRSNTSLKTAATSVAVPPPPPSSRSAKQQRMLSVPSFLPDSSRESNLRRSQRGMPLNSAAQLVLEDGFKSSGGPARSSWGRSLLSPPSAGAADLPRQHVVTRSGRRGETSAAPRPRSEEVDRTGDPLMPDTSNDVRFCRT